MQYNQGDLNPFGFNHNSVQSVQVGMAMDVVC